MNEIKRIKVRESIDNWNEKNPDKPKKTALTVAESIGIDNRNLSLWNKEMPKQVKALCEISEVLNFKLDGLFGMTDRCYNLERLPIRELLHNSKITFTDLSCQVAHSSESRLRLWDQGQLPFGIINFWNFCKELNVLPSQAIEY